MKNRILSTGFGVALALATLFPLNPSSVLSADPSYKRVNVNGDFCEITVVTLDGTIVCLDDLSQDNVSWNSGGG